MKDAGVLFDVFQQHGHQRVDTARIHGEDSCEEYLGELHLQERGHRKIRSLWRRNQPHSRRSHLLEPLKALKTEKLDLWCLHGPDRQTSFEEILRACNGLHQEMCIQNGWIRPTFYVGVYNAIHRTVELELFPCLRYYRIAFDAFNPLAGDILNSRYHRGTEELEYRIPVTF